MFFGTYGFTLTPCASTNPSTSHELTWSYLKLGSYPFWLLQSKLGSIIFLCNCNHLSFFEQSYNKKARVMLLRSTWLLLSVSAL